MFQKMSRMPFGNRLSYARRYVRDAVKDRRQDAFAPIRAAPHHPNPASWRDDAVTVAWLGHATVLLNVFGTWLITDPALKPRIGLGRGIAKFGPKRLVQPALRSGELPRLDGVLLSHAHMDHTDLETLAALRRDTRVVVQPGNADLVRRFREVRELAWGEAVTVGEVRIESVPVSHWGARMITDKHRGYGGYILESRDRRIVFAGDTAYTDALRPVGQRGRVDLAIVPIGAYDPWIYNHASPEQAWKMARDLGAEHVLPIHHSTFRLSREPLDEPLQRFVAAAGRERWRVVGTEIGATWAPTAPVGTAY